MSVATGATFGCGGKCRRACWSFNLCPLKPLLWTAQCSQGGGNTLDIHHRYEVQRRAGPVIKSRTARWMMPVILCPLTHTHTRAHTSILFPVVCSCKNSTPTILPDPRYRYLMVKRQTDTQHTCTTCILLAAPTVARQASVDDREQKAKEAQDLFLVKTT